MKSYLFISNDPSLIRDVESCYKENREEIEKNLGKLDFFCTGRIPFCYQEPEEYDEFKGLSEDLTSYPMIPKRWRVKTVAENEGEELQTFVDSLKHYDGLIAGTSADISGYGVYDRLEQILGTRKKETLRFIERARSVKEIKESLLSMTDYHTDKRYKYCLDAAKMRAQADWLYGKNASRMLVRQAGFEGEIGRLEAPLVKMVYENSAAVETSEIEKYAVVVASYGGIKGQMVEPGTTTPFVLDLEADFPEIPLEGQVVRIETESCKEHAPQLYDLTSIQIEAGRVYGYSPSKTQAGLWELYEKHKRITYPGTEVRVISSGRGRKIGEILEAVKDFDDLKRLTQRISDGRIREVLYDSMVVSDKTIEEEGIQQDAILPIAGTVDLSELSEPAKNLYYMICKRLVCEFLPAYEEVNTTMVIRHGDYDFVVKGKQIPEPGWKAMYVRTKESLLPKASEGDVITAEMIRPMERKKLSTRRYTSYGLLEAMASIVSRSQDQEWKLSMTDSKGIGVEKERSELILSILRKGYISEDEDGLYITSMGKVYAELFQDNDIHLVYPEFAAELEQEIRKIQKGDATYQEVYENICEDVSELAREIQSAKKLQRITKTSCPACGDRLDETGFYYECKDCGWKLQRYICGVTYGEDTLRRLIDGKNSEIFTFRAKGRAPFQARLRMKEDHSGVEFRFPGATGELECPFCGEIVKIGQKGVYCECKKLKLPRTFHGREFNDMELRTILRTGCCNNLGGFIGKTGSSFDANVKLNMETGKMEFDGFVTRKGKPSRR